MNNILKKTLSVLLCSALIGSIITTAPFIDNYSCITANAEELYESFEYTLSDDLITINRYTGNAENVTIPSLINGNTVTAVGDFAFEQCTELTSINIPDSITSIGVSAFRQCDNLVSVIIPDSVVIIGDHAFGYTITENSEEQKLSDFTIYGTAGSAAEEYADREEFRFVETVVLIKSIPKTCTTDGKQEYYHNSFNNKDYEDSSCNIEIPDIDSWGIIPAPGHNYELVSEKTADCTESGEKVYKCAVCGETMTETIDPTGHDYETEIVGPTCTEEGYTLYTCSVCGDSFTNRGHYLGELVKNFSNDAVEFNSIGTNQVTVTDST